MLAWGGFALYLAIDHVTPGDAELLAAPIAIVLAAIAVLGAARSLASRASRSEKVIAFLCNTSFPAVVALFVIATHSLGES
jgi:hypothetical protein